MSKKLWASDYDGTLYKDPNNRAIEPKDKEFIKEFKQQNNVFALDSGRLLPELVEIANEEGIEVDYYVCGNGTTLYNKTGEKLFENILSIEDKEKVWDYFVYKKVNFGFASEELRYVVRYEEHEYLQPKNYSWTKEVELDVDHLQIFVSEDVQIIYIWVEHEEQNNYLEYINQISPTLRGTITGYNLIEIIPINANKAEPLEIIMKKENINIDDVYTTGDGHNDIELVSFNQNGFAMAHGNPEAINAAKHKIKYVHELKHYMK